MTTPTSSGVGRQANQLALTQADLDGLGRKLDEFQEVLTERERAVMTILMELAGRELRDRLAGQAPAGTTGAPSLPPLSSGFRDALEPGIGRDFALESVDAEGGYGIGVVTSAR